MLRHSMSFATLLVILALCLLLSSAMLQAARNSITVLLTRPWLKLLSAYGIPSISFMASSRLMPSLWAANPLT